MEEGPYISIQLAKKLLLPPKDRLNFNQYIQIMENEKKLTYLSCKSFCEKITQYVQGSQADRFIASFKLQFDNNRKTQQQYNYHFPFIEQEEKFTKHILHTFVVEYNQESTANNQKDSKSFGHNPMIQKNLDQETQNFDDFEQQSNNNGQKIVYFDSSTHVPRQYDYEKQMEEKMKQFQQKIPAYQDYYKPIQNDYIYKLDFQGQYQEIIIDEIYRIDQFIQKDKKKAPQKDKNKTPQKDKQIEIKSDINNTLKKYMIPKYFLNKSKAISTLLALNFTDYFKNQLEQVKILLKSNIKNIPFYNDLFEQYLEYYYFVDGELEIGLKDHKQLIKNHLAEIQSYFLPKSKTIKYRLTKRKSILMQVWQFLHRKLKNQKKSNKFEQRLKNLNAHLQKGIELIFLIFKLNIQQNHVYGFTKDMNISININFLPYQHNLQNYSQGVMKPYIAFTAYHELAHFLIRSFNQEEHDISGQSFNIASDSLGKNILDMVLRRRKEIPPYLKKNQQKSMLVKICTPKQYIKKMEQLSYNLTQEQSSIFKQLESQAKEYYQLISKIDVIANVFSNFSTKRTEIQMDSQKWKSLKDYIDKLQKCQTELSIQQDEQNQFKYEIFFSYFLLPGVVSLIVKDFPDKIYEYNLMRDKIKNIKNLKVKRFFVQKNHAIDKFCQKIIQQREKNQHQKRGLPKDLQEKKVIIQQVQFLSFKDIMLFQGNHLQNINNQIKQIYIEFKPKTLKSFTLQFNQIIQCSQIETILPQLNLSKFKKIKKNCYLKDFLMQIDAFKQLVQAYQSYQMLMNFMKYHEYLVISFQAPSFFTHDAFDSQQLPNEHLQSGYDIQRRMFPQLIQSQTIYAKDYQLMKKIGENASRLAIGKKPENPVESRKSLPIKKGILYNNNIVGFSLNSWACGNRLMKEARLKQEREMKDAKRVKLSSKKQ